MKKLYAILALLAVSVTGLHAQATPNSGFETWTSHTGYNTPDNWDNANATTAILGVYTCVKATAAADVHSGSAAIRLITQTYVGNKAPGIATTGTINTSTQTVGGGIPYTQRPDSITGWYKYTSVSGDRGFVSFTLFGTSNTDTVAQAYFATPAASVGTYTRFSQALVYRSNHTVTNSIWILLSSQNQASGQVGSSMYVDDLAIVINPSSGIQSLQAAPQISVGPNPAVNQIAVSNVSNAKVTFVLYDITGRILVEQKLENSSNTFDVSSIPAGLYVYAILDEKNKMIQTSKLIIRH
ncbi:MAG TPA: T9SS type A sorting domain-containing protein [Bacteroidia bacterium]|jgi:hypothetical protein|nr:T9SS type A sorting domain-containing protein [Bacteroidia bacterium]